MSLIQSRWVVPGAAAVLAVIAPFWLLQPDSAKVEPPPPLVVTDLSIAPVGGLEQARATPIFSPTRAPPEAATASASEAGPQAAPPQPLPALVGVVSRARGKGVALVKSSNGQTLTLEPGQSVDGWQLVGIGRDRATFAMNGERRVAALDFSNKTAGEGAPPPSASAPIPPPPANLPASATDQRPLPAWPEPWLANQSGSPR
jgi:hypothetical protein